MGMISQDPIMDGEEVCQITEIAGLKKGLARAISLLEDSCCEHCGGSLVDLPNPVECGDQNHVMKALEIAKLQRILAS